MRQMGIAAIVIGLTWLAYGYFRDSTVSGYVNLGLMELRRNHMMIGIAVALAGVILFGFGSVKKQNSADDERDATKKKCPTCAEFVKAEATICRFCNHALPSLAEINALQEAEWEKAEKFHALSPEEKAVAAETMPKGICPSCEQLIPIYTLECKCGARFGRMSDWKIRPA